jgi:large repetitive protein
MATGLWARRASRALRAGLAARFSLSVLWVGLALLASLNLARAAPAAGSVIENTARATYFDTDRGFNATLVSNTVSVTVQPLEALLLTSDNTLRRAAGGIASLPHRLTNTGNASSTYVLTYANRADDDVDLSGLRLVWDKNGNGVADSGEPGIASGATFGPLAAGESADFVLAGTVPDGTLAGRVARLELNARSVAQGVAASNVDNVTVAEGAQLQIVAAVSNLAPNPGETVTVTLSASNTGNRPASGVVVTVDGAITTLLLVRDVIPANTTFAAFGPVGGAVALYHLRGQPDLSYSRSAPADLRQVDAIAFGFALDMAPGQSVTRSLELRINANAAGPIVDSGWLMFMDGVQTQPSAVESNAVRMVVAGAAPALRLYGDARYGRGLAVLRAGQPFYVALDAARCNLDPLRAETHQVTVASALTGDAESYVATETGPNTGVFHIEPAVPTSDALTTPMARGDGRVSVRPNDQLLVSATGCGATLMQASALVDPFGVVFDSKTDAPLAGAIVTLIDVSGAGNGGHPGAPARVLLADGVSAAPSVLTTGADGHYQFPLVAPSVYRLVVTPPSPYTAPSTLAISLLPAGHSIDAAGSYAGSFTITEASAPVRIDIPLDADPRAGFFIEKTSARTTVEIGEFVDYQIKVKNVTGQLLGRIRVTDQLPAGFAYLRGSARLDGGSTRLDRSALPEPEGGVGPVLVFNLGSINDSAVFMLTYRVRVGPGALQGDGINRAQATSAGPLPKLSNESRAAVQVLPGVFSDRGLLVGNVYADCNRNRERDDAEPGIAGVRLFLEDGTHVTTDRLGRYSLYGLRPQTHVLKLDATTLPFSVGPQGAAVLARLDNRQAGDPGSRFVDMKNGELQRADFAVEGCSETVVAAIAARAEAAARNDEDTETARDARLGADPRMPAVADVKALPASGLVGAGNLPFAATGGALRGANARGVSSPETAVALLAARTSAVRSVAAPATPSDAELATLDNTVAILSPTDSQVLGQAQTTVVVKGALGAELRLRVNGVELPVGRIGRLTRLESRGLQVAEYIGVGLVPGRNTLELLQAGGAASAPTLAAINIIAPGPLAKLRISVPDAERPADGHSAVRVTIEPLDAAGVPVAAPTPVTLNLSRGRWLFGTAFRDLDPDEPGVQVFIEGGRLVAELESPADSGDLLVQAASGSVQAQTKIEFLPELRPMIAAGVVEGVLNLRRLDSRALQPTRAQDGFEQELQHAVAHFDNGRADAAGRAALYLKGKVLGDTLLTLAYDSDKGSRERLFRDIQPGEYYPVYGDDSVKGFDAQSTGRLYVRLDRGKSSLLYGDFNTQPETTLAGSSANASGSAAMSIDEKRLGQYSRSLNGARAQLRSDDGRSALTAFASQTSSRQVVDELPALGTSGPYPLSRAPLVENSEKVELLTRDREQGALVLRRVPLARFVDYEIETLTGRLILKAPLATLDAGFNPNSLRVTYEVDDGGPMHWVGGAALRIEAGEQLTLNAGAVRDNDPLQPLTLQTLGATLRVAPGTAAAVEIAHTETPLGAQAAGSAARIELRHESERLLAQAQVVRAGTGFDNPSAAVTKGRQEATAKLAWKAGERTTVKAELLRSDDLVTKTVREGAQLSVEQALGDTVRAEVGVRHSRGSAIEVGASPTAPTAPTAGSAAATPEQATTVIVKLTAQLPELPRASVIAEYEQDIAHADRRVAALGGEYRLDAATRLYGRYEFISSLGSRYGLNDQQQRNATVFGVQTEYLTDANLFSEYRLREALDGRTAEAAIGLRNRWRLGGGWSVSTGYERVRSLDGSAAANPAANPAPGVALGTGDSTAITGGLEYAGVSDWKGAARLELRNSTSSDTVLSTLGLAYKIDDAWTALGRNLLTVSRQPNASGKTEDWLQFGLAWRERGANRRNALLRAEYRFESADDPLAPASRRNVVTASAHINQQVSAQLVLSGRIAAKWAREQSLGLADRYHTELFAARATYDIATGWDIGVQAAALIGSGGRARQMGLGAEAGHLLAENLWLSVGWNQFGFTDRDLTAQDYLQRGVYLRLRFKFDEASL